MKSVLSPKTIIKSNSNDIRAIIWLHFLLDQGSNQNDLLINVKEMKVLCLPWGVFFSYMKFYRLSPETLFSECMSFIFSFWLALCHKKLLELIASIRKRRLLGLCTKLSLVLLLMHHMLFLWKVHYTSKTKWANRTVLQLILLYMCSISNTVEQRFWNVYFAERKKLLKIVKQNFYREK